MPHCQAFIYCLSFIIHIFEACLSGGRFTLVIFVHHLLTPKQVFIMKHFLSILLLTFQTVCFGQNELSSVERFNIPSISSRYFAIDDTYNEGREMFAVSPGIQILFDFTDSVIYLHRGDGEQSDIFRLQYDDGSRVISEPRFCPPSYFDEYPNAFCYIIDFENSTASYPESLTKCSTYFFSESSGDSVPNFKLEKNCRYENGFSRFCFPLDTIEFSGEKRILKHKIVYGEKPYTFEFKNIQTYPQTDGSVIVSVGTFEYFRFFVNGSVEHWYRRKLARRFIYTADEQNDVKK